MEPASLGQSWSSMQLTQSRVSQWRQSREQAWHLWPPQPAQSLWHPAPSEAKHWRRPSLSPSVRVGPSRRNRCTSSLGRQQIKTAPLDRGMMPRSPRVSVPSGRGGPTMAPLSKKSPCSAETQAQSSRSCGGPCDPAVPRPAVLCRAPHSMVCPTGHNRQHDVWRGRLASRPHPNPH